MASRNGPTANRRLLSTAVSPTVTSSKPGGAPLSQLVPTQSLGTIPVNAATSGVSVRSRPKVLIPEQRLEEALQLSHEGKITSRNAWSVQLLEGMEQGVSSVLSQQEIDNYAQFTRAAHLVEGGAKVWTQRVESTYLLSSQIVRRLLRNDGQDDGEGGDGTGDAKMDAQEKRQAAYRRRRAMQRTVAENLEEINYDGWIEKVKQHMTGQRMGGAHGPAGSQNQRNANVKPSFRAITERFDQSQASGLLVHNAATGLAGNLILDKDFSRCDDWLAQSAGGALDSARVSTVLPPAVSDVPSTPSGRPSATIRPFSEEFDDDCQAPVRLSAQSMTHLSAGRLPASARPSGVNVFPQVSLPLAPTGPAPHVAGGGHSPTEGDGRPLSRAPSVFSQFDHMQRGNGSDDDGDGGGGAGDEGLYDGGGDDAADASPSMDSPEQRGRATGLASLARGVIAGNLEVDAFDSQLKREQDVCALMAEDPDNWVPLVGGGAGGATGASAGSGGAAMLSMQLGSGALGLIRRESRAAGAKPSQNAARLGGEGVVEAVLGNEEEDGGRGARRRVGDKRTVSFANVALLDPKSAPSALIAKFVAHTKKALDASQEPKPANANVLTAIADMEAQIEESLLPVHDKLRLNRSRLLAVTPRGRELLASGATDKMLAAYAEPSYCNAKAKDNGLIMPAAVDVVTGRKSDAAASNNNSDALPPAWSATKMLEDVTMFFQPFSTASRHWNVMLKTSRHRGHGVEVLENGTTRRFMAQGADASDDRGGADTCALGDRVVMDMPVLDEDVSGQARTTGGSFAQGMMGGKQPNNDDDDFGGEPHAGLYDDDGPDEGMLLANMGGAENSMAPPFALGAAIDIENVLHGCGVDTSPTAGGADGPGRPSLAARGSGGAGDVALRVQTATAPTQVDVARLRSVMWEKTRVAAKGSTMEQPAGSTAAAHAAEPSQTTCFSEVIEAMLPEVPRIAKDGSLSPAFFFFSLLFLANEHNLVLRQAEGMSSQSWKHEGEEAKTGRETGKVVNDTAAPSQELADVIITLS